MDTKKPSTKRVRAFSVITYHSVSDVQELLWKHNQSVRAYAYILHDQDETASHIHLIFRTYDAWTSTQILKWFDAYKAIDGQNTLVEPANDLSALGEYLTHSDLTSIAEGKHRYKISDIVDGGLFESIEKHDSIDNTYEIINAIINRTPTKQLVRLYGRQLIYHYSQFQQVAEAIVREEQFEAARLVHQRYMQEHADLKPIPLDQVNMDDI